MKTIYLQAGHQNIQTNCFADMHGGTGAPGEILWTPMMRARVGSHLKAHGFDVHQADANLNCLPKPNPAPALTLALHYQSNNPTTSGFGVYVPDVDLDLSHAESVRIGNLIRKTYAKRTALDDCSDPYLKGPGRTWSNVNTRRYYLWQTQPGPLVLIECGVGAAGAPDHDLLWKHPDVVAAAIAEGICVAFGVKWTNPAPVPVPPTPPPPPPVPIPEPKPEPPPVPPPPVVVVPEPPVEAPPGGWKAFIAWLKRVLGIP